MPSKHNAEVVVRFSDEMVRGTVKFYLTARGSPDDMRRVIKLSVRLQRRQIMANPEIFAMNLLRYCLNTTDVIWQGHGQSWNWKYVINFLPEVPHIRVISRITDSTNDYLFWEFIGPERRPPTHLKPTPDRPSFTRRRGRPAAISKDERLRGMFVPAPDSIDPQTGEPIFNNNRSRRKA